MTSNYQRLHISFMVLWLYIYGNIYYTILMVIIIWLLLQWLLSILIWVNDNNSLT